MSFENSAGLNVNNHYGPRESGKTVGVVKTEGRVYEASIYIDSETISNGGPLLVDLKLPDSAIIEDAYVEVTEAFALTGTSPTILVGTDTSEATNGLAISEAQAEAVGTYDVTSTLTGTWASPLAAETTVGVALGGTTPAVGSAGKAKVIVRYTKVA